MTTYTTETEAKDAITALLRTGKRATPIAADQISNIEHETVLHNVVETLFDNAAVDVVLSPEATATANVDKIQAAIDAADGREYRTRILLTGEWELNDQIVVDNKIDIIGGKFTRSNETKATTTSTISTTASSFAVSVDSVPSHWKVGTRLVVRDPAIVTANDIGANSHINVGLADGDSTTMRIDAIDGINITIGNGSGSAFAAGVELVQVIDLFRVGDQVQFFGCSFDGNKDNNPLETWLTNVSIACDPNQQSANSLGVFYCRFENNPSETMFVTLNATISDCYWHNNNGSIVHVTTQPTGALTSGEGVNVIRPYAADCCLKALSMNHSEAYITFSIRSKFLTVKDGDFINTTRFTGTQVGTCDVIGHISHIDDDSQIVVENMRCKNFNRIAYFEPITAGQGDDVNRSYFRFSNNRFVSCGDISSFTTNISGGEAQYADLIVEGNRFWGTRIHLGSFLNVCLRSNHFYYQGYQSSYFGASDTGRANSESALLYVYGDMVKMQDNEIHAHIDSADNEPVLTEQTDGTDIEVAIRVESESASDQLRKHHEVVISGNRIYAWRFGIHVGGNTTTSSSSDYQKNVLVDSNLIVAHNGGGSNGSAGIPIVTKPGTVCQNNVIIGVEQVVRGISCNGAATGYSDRWSFIKGNTIRLNQTPSSASIQNPSSSAAEALCVKDNICSTAISMNGSPTNQVLDGNVTTTVEPDLATDWEFHIYEAPF